MIRERGRTVFFGLLSQDACIRIQMLSYLLFDGLGIHQRLLKVVEWIWKARHRPSLLEKGDDSRCLLRTGHIRIGFDDSKTRVRTNSGISLGEAKATLS